MSEKKDLGKVDDVAREIKSIVSPTRECYQEIIDWKFPSSLRSRDKHKFDYGGEGQTELFQNNRRRRNAIIASFPFSYDFTRCAASVSSGAKILKCRWHVMRR